MEHLDGDNKIGSFLFYKQSLFQEELCFLKGNRQFLAL